jgi:hypothetical protein
MKYLEAKEIRKLYPRTLTKNHIQEILVQWHIMDDFDGHEMCMFQFACSPETDGKMNKSELKLWFLYSIKYYTAELMEYNKSHEDADPAELMVVGQIRGFTIFTWFKEFIGGGTENSTQTLRIEMIKLLFKTWKETSNHYTEQREEVQHVIDIKKSVYLNMLERYPNYKFRIKPDSFENRCWNLIEYLIKE